MSAIDSIPTALEVEHAAAVLRGAAAQLAVYIVEEELESGEQVGYWEAPATVNEDGTLKPSGNPPAPGAADEALGLLKVAVALENVSGPLTEFMRAMESGMSPMDFLMSQMLAQSEEDTANGG